MLAFQTHEGHTFLMEEKEKNQAAVELGKLGGKARASIPGEMSRIVNIRWAQEDADPVKMSKMGKVGGRARAEALSPEQRKEIARKASAARWANKRGTVHPTVGEGLNFDNSDEGSNEPPSDNL